MAKEPTEYTLVISESQIIGILTGAKKSIGGLPPAAKIIDISYDNEKDEMYIKYIIVV